LLAAFGFCFWGFFEGLIRGGDGGRALDAFAFHQFFHGVELKVRVSIHEGRGLLIFPFFFFLVVS